MTTPSTGSETLDVMFHCLRNRIVSENRHRTVCIWEAGVPDRCCPARQASQGGESSVGTNGHCPDQAEHPIRTVWMRCCGSPFRPVILRAVGLAETPGTTGHRGLTGPRSVAGGRRFDHGQAWDETDPMDCPAPRSDVMESPCGSVADWLLDRQLEPYALSLGQIAHTPGV